MKSGISAFAGHEAAHLNGATLVVASAAVKKDNPEIVAARAQGIPVISRAEMLGRLMARYPRSVAITGTHGKTTTTGMTAMVLEAGRPGPDRADRRRPACLRRQCPAGRQRCVSGRSL